MARGRTIAITLASAAALAMAVPQVKQYEGLWLTVKPDRLAGGLPTGGYGETEGVKLGETHDEPYWAAMLAKRLPEYDRKIGACIKVQLPDEIRATAISMAYNAGPAAVCRSPAVAKWNEGDLKGGCESIRKWYICSHPRKGGPCVVQRGLVNRRNDEANHCLKGINKNVRHPIHVPHATTDKNASVEPTGGRHWWQFFVR